MSTPFLAGADCLRGWEGHRLRNFLHFSSFFLAMARAPKLIARSQLGMTHVHAARFGPSNIVGCCWCPIFGSMSAFNEGNRARVGMIRPTNAFFSIYVPCFGLERLHLGGRLGAFSAL